MRKIKAVLRYLGVPRLLAARKIPEFLSDYSRFGRMFRASGEDRRFAFGATHAFPVLLDKTASQGFDRHYIFHTAWAARVVSRLAPTELVDISSSLYFSSIVSAFLPVRFYDYRPAALDLPGLTSSPGDLMRLPFADASLECVSCMHVVEHVGLGRYGDPLDPNGDLKAARELARVVRPAGHLIFVVPVGRPAIRFNAHRVYSYQQVLDRFPDLQLVEFSLIQDDHLGGAIVRDADPSLVASQAYGCGLFLFRKG